MPMSILTASSFLLAFILTPLVRDFAHARGWVDMPDNRRKKHHEAVPRIGGIPIVIAYVGSFVVLHMVEASSDSPEHWALSAALRLLPALAVIFATGLADDIYSLKPWQKLAGQTLAAALACLGGIQIDTLAGYAIGELPGRIITVLWLVGCANAFNLIDGVDGLASGLGLVATITAFGAGLLNGDTGLMMATAPLAGALLGFLLFNFNPASIFLGDSGSLWVGFMLGCYAVIWSQKSATLLGLTAPVIALCVPLLDTGLSIARRFLRRQPIFSADNGHIHHRLLQRGLTPRGVALFLYAVGGIAAVLSILVQSTQRSSVGGLVIVLFCASIWLGIQYLGYQEFDIALRVFRNNSLRTKVKHHLALRQCEEALRAANTPEECWKVVLQAAGDFGFSDIALKLGSRGFHHHQDLVFEPQWVLQIPLSDCAYVRLTSQYGSPVTSETAAPFADLLHRVLPTKEIVKGQLRHMPSRRPPGSAPGSNGYQRARHARTIPS